MPASLPFKISQKHNAVLIKEDQRVKNVIPHVQSINKNGNVHHYGCWNEICPCCKKALNSCDCDIESVGNND